MGIAPRIEGPVTHHLKCAAGWFEAISLGLKTAELRSADRDFCPLDIVRLHEIQYDKPTGRTLERRITHIVWDSNGPWLAPGFCMLSLAIVEGSSGPFDLVDAAARAGTDAHRRGGGMEKTLENAAKVLRDGTDTPAALGEAIADIIDEARGRLGVAELLVATTRNQLARLVALLLEEGLLSEAQIARICIAHPDLIEVRKLRDEGLENLRKMPLGGSWGAATSKRLGLHDASDIEVAPHPGDPCLDCDGSGKGDFGGPCVHCDGTGGACDE